MYWTEVSYEERGKKYREEIRQMEEELFELMSLSQNFKY